jgi:transcriptional regulator with XRE-family HTH domain
LRKRFASNAVAFDNHPMEIGKVIRVLRQKRGETLEQVALGVGTDPSNLSRIERGVQQPSAELLRAIAAALQTTIGSLYSCAEGQEYSADKTQDLLGAEESDYTSESIQLRRQFRALTPENQRLAVELLKTLNRMQGAK